MERELDMSNPLFIVTFDHVVRIPGLPARRSNGTYELDFDRMSASNIADDIFDGQFDGVAKVYECFPGESCNDVTEVIAMIVRDRIRQAQIEPRYELVNWLHSVLGADSIAWPLQAAE